ncbi:hypothetical protein E2C01_066118 [Portunus trituberculatus]|uniref:Uncharacterized protein n=1 Tax=Portunus trituberculatus TaxID=210409 RepID=A0A5B7HT07_PORTR|nr:hypothetical protein [Portunus trituberculatus]
MNRIGMGERRKSRATRLREERHAVSKIRRAVGMKIAVEDTKRFNIAVVSKKAEVRGEELIRQNRFHPI